MTASAPSEDGFDPTPPTLGVGVAVLPAAVAVVGTGFRWPSVVLVAVGALALALGVQRGARRLLAAGTATAFVGVLLAGLTAGAAPIVLVAAVSTVLAWDLGEHAIGLGEQVGSRADARRSVLAHAGTSTAVFGTIAAVSYLVYVLARSGDPGAAAAVLAGAAALFAVVSDW